VDDQNSTILASNLAVCGTFQSASLCNIFFNQKCALSSFDWYTSCVVLSTHYAPFAPNIYDEKLYRVHARCPKGRFYGQLSVIIIYAVFCRKSGEFHEHIARPVNVKLEQKESRACLVKRSDVSCLLSSANIRTWISFHLAWNARRGRALEFSQKSIIARAKSHDGKPQSPLADPKQKHPLRNLVLFMVCEKLWWSHENQCELSAQE